MAMIRIGAVLLLWAGLLPAQAAERWVGNINAKITIGTDGKVADVALIRPTVSKAMQQTLIERVRRVEFEPAIINGQPATAETTVSIGLGVDERPDGLSVVVDGIAVIAGYKKTTPPQYPARELRRGVNGEVMIKVDFDSNGKVLSVAPAQADAPMNAFMKAALAAAVHWELEPQRVGGIGIASTAIIPVRFQIADQSPAESGSGDLRFGDGGHLHVHRTQETQWTLADSAVRMRSLGAAEGAIGDGS